MFPGIDNSQDFDLVVFDKGGSTEAFDAAFLTRETEHAIQTFRAHPNYMRLEPDDIRRLSPQTLTFFEFKGRRDLDIVRKAYRLHPPFGQGLMPKLGLKYRHEFDMGNMHIPISRPRMASPPRLHSGAGRDLASSRRGVVSEPGLRRAADRRLVRRVRRRHTLSITASPGRSPRARLSAAPTSTTSRSASTSLADSASTAKGPTTAARPPSSFPPTRPEPTDAPVYVPGRKFLVDLTIPPCLRPGDVFLPLMEGKWIYQHKYNRFAYVYGLG